MGRFSVCKYKLPLAQCAILPAGSPCTHCANAGCVLRVPKSCFASNKLRGWAPTDFVATPETRKTLLNHIIKCAEAVATILGVSVQALKTAAKSWRADAAVRPLHR